jgi:D-glycero-D-manno-heptose 1,7-bisphosphate phosphatase
MSSGYSTTVFIDRDGTVNVNLAFPNVNRPEKVELLPLAAEGIKVLNDINARVIIVTNQAGINNPDNDFTNQDYQRVSDRFKQLLKDSAEAEVDDIFCCPHFHTENCGCRKPKTGLFDMAKEKYSDINFKQSFVIGDRSDDIIAGRKLGMRTILVRTGHGKKTEEELGDTEEKPNHTVDDLYQAALKVAEKVKE